MLTQQLDHASVALGKLAEQFKIKANIRKFLEVFAAQVQDLESAFWTLRIKRWLANAEGVNLDTIGKIVGEPRGTSLDDAEYRLRIQARIKINRSNGRHKDLYGILRLFLPTSVLRITPNFPAGFVYYIGDAISEAHAVLFAGFVHDAKGAAIGSHFEWNPQGDDTAFTFDVSAFLTADVNPGDTVLPVVTTTGFPDSGVLRLDAGTGDEESAVVYTSRGLHHFNIDDATMFNPHMERSQVALATSPGLGFGDESNPAIGGGLAGVIAS